MSAWDGIDEFVAVAEANSFRRGGEALGLSTTHMSRSIAQLEARIQTRLFSRTTRKIMLTDTGRTLLDHCQRMITQREEAFAMINEQGEPQGNLRITCSIAMGERFIAPLIREFSLSYPKISVRLDLTNRMIDLIGEGYDLAIRTGNMPDSRLIAKRIASRDFITCASPAYLQANGRPTRIADLDHHECLIGTSSTWRFTHNGENELYKPKGRWQCNNGAATLEAAKAGLGICQLPEFYILPALSTGELEAILTSFGSSKEPIWAVYPRRQHLLPKVSMLVDLIEKKLPEALIRGV